ncbi:Uncharacterised protein [Serratia fonticola]|nr:Uncharacterised protein [Serratia fonticola]
MTSSDNIAKNSMLTDGRLMQQSPTEPVVMLTDSQFAVNHLIPINIDGSLSRTFTECTRGLTA